jgi:hypothetical protein
MQRAMSKIGLTLGFYGGIAVVGWFYQLLFMPETKNKTLEEIDILFSQPTSELVKENFKNVTQTTSDLLHLRWRKVFSPSAESELREKHGSEGIEPISEKVQGWKDVGALSIIVGDPRGGWKKTSFQVLRGLRMLSDVFCCSTPASKHEMYPSMDSSVRKMIWSFEAQGWVFAWQGKLAAAWATPARAFDWLYGLGFPPDLCSTQLASSMFTLQP